MANFSVIPRRLTKIVRNSIENWKLVPAGWKNNSYFDDTRKCFMSHATVVLFKDSMCNGGSSKKPDCPEKSSSSSSDNTCENKKKCSISEDTRRGCESTPRKNKFEDIPRSMNKQQRCMEISSISGTNSCDSDSRKFAIPRKLDCELSPALDDPCPRECKLSSTLRHSDSSPRQKSCPEPTSMCSPTDELARKERFWGLLTLLGALPAVIISTIIIGMRAEEESKKPRPKYVPMDYLNRRTKRFPWGDGNHSLFHNPVKNAVPPDGYEVDDPNEVKKNN